MRYFLLLLAAFPASGGPPSNTLTLRSTGAAENNHPVSFGRTFAKGEIRGYAMPLVNGVAPAYWQNDNVQRHRDGRSSCVITSITNTTPPRVTCPNHGFLSGEYVTISGTNGYNGRHKITYWTRDKFFLSEATANGAESSGVATGPGGGSLRHATISFLVDLPASPEILTISFVSSPSRTSDPNYASPSAADLLNFNNGNWGAAQEWSQTNVTTRTINARTMIADGKYRLWLNGPAVWQVVVEDESEAASADFSILCVSNCSDTYSTAAWQDSSGRANHPWFILTFWRNWPGVQIAYGADHNATSDPRDQRWTLTLKSGADLSTTKYTNTHTFYFRTRWIWPNAHIVNPLGWDGTAPVRHNLNHNAAYLRYSKAIPFYDNLDVSGNIATDYANWTGSDKTLGTGNGLMLKSMADSGGRPDLGLIPRWYAVWLLAGGDYRYDEIAFGQADLSGHIPTHLRETSTVSNYAKYLDLDGSGASSNDSTSPSSYNRPVSLDARPGFYTAEPFRTDAQDYLTPASPCCSWSHGWGVNTAHYPAQTYIVWALTGDYYYLREQQFHGAYMAGTHWWPLNPNDSWWTRHGSSAIAAFGHEVRGHAWSIREVAAAAMASPPGSAEFDYFYSKLVNTLSKMEGFFAIKNGQFWRPTTGGTKSNPCPNYAPQSTYSPDNFSPYCWAYNGGVNTASIVDQYWASTLCDDWTIGAGVSSCTSPWMVAYNHLVFNWISDWHPMQALKSRLAQWSVGIVKHPEFNPYMCCSYRAPKIVSSTGGYPTSFGQWKAMFVSSYQNKSDWNGDGLSSTGHAYPHIFRSALSHNVGQAYGPARGWEAWDWWKSNTQYWSESAARLAAEPVFAYSAPYDPVQNVRVISGDTFAIIEYTKPRAEEACTVNGVSDGVTSSRVVRFVLSGLAPQTSGDALIECPSDPFGAARAWWNTTEAASGSGWYRWKALGVTRLRYGDSPGQMNTVTEFADCSAGCQIAMPRGLRYVRVERPGGAAGPVTPVAVR
jgi:hypothetical protein